MIIRCENCDTKYTIPDGQIGASGRFVRCTHCAHEWLAYATPASAATSTPVSEVVPQSLERVKFQNYEAEYESKNHLLFYGSIFFALIGLAINMMLGGMTVMDKVGFPYHERNDLRINNIVVKIHSSKLPSMQEVGLDIVVYNMGSKPEHLSNIRITAFDKDRQRIAELTSSNSYVVNPNEQRVVHSWIKDVPVATRYIAIEFGGHLELAIRAATSLVTGRVVG